MVVNNSVMIDNLKPKYFLLVKKVSVLIDKNIWPLTDFVINRDIGHWVLELQKIIANLHNVGESESAMKLIEKYCFSIIIRLFAIESVRKRKDSDTVCYDGICFDTKDYARAFELLEMSHPKFIVKDSFYISKFFAKDVDISQNDGFGKIRRLGITNVLEHILQCQFKILLDPY
jgi:hypothetical protein